MAIWQFDFIIVPKSGIEAFSTDKQLNFETLHKLDLWAENYLIDDFNGVNNFLSLGESWNEDIICFGDENSHSIQVLLDKDYVKEVIFRLDFSKEYLNFLEEVLEYCLLNGFVILDQDLQIVSNDVHLIIEKIERSPQFAMHKKLSSNGRNYE